MGEPETDVSLSRPRWPLAVAGGALVAALVAVFVVASRLVEGQHNTNTLRIVAVAWSGLSRCLAGDLRPPATPEGRMRAAAHALATSPANADPNAASAGPWPARCAKYARMAAEHLAPARGTAEPRYETLRAEVTAAAALLESGALPPDPDALWRAAAAASLPPVAPTEVAPLPRLPPAPGTTPEYAAP